MGGQITYTLQVTVYYVARVEVVKAVCHIPQLRDLTFICSTEVATLETEQLTRPTRSASGCFFEYTVILSFSIHSQTISKGGTLLGTPRKGTMLGCCNLFQTTTSL